MLWAITSYYNPENYKTRYNNFKKFKENLKVPSVVVEFSNNGKFQLSQDDASILIQIPKGDLMWQKERLLNIALKFVPTHVENVAWLDCDVIIDDPDWNIKAEKLLQENKIIQLYSHMAHLRKGDFNISHSNNVLRSSLVNHIKNFGFDPKTEDTYLDIEFERKTLDKSLVKYKEPGFAWAAKRELLSKHGFYDKNIVGGGDNAVACSVYLDIDGFIRRNFTETVKIIFFEYQRKSKYFSECKKSYLDWAIPFNKDVDGKIDCLDSTLYHLWHGDLDNRNYYKRYRDVCRIGFNPYEDIELNEWGVYQWARKTKLENYLINYFKVRSEDSIEK